MSIDQINHLVSYGDNFTINCTVDAKPQATQVFWIKSNLKLHELVELNAGLPGTMGITVDEPSLTITYATESDAGLYACFAINEIGKGSSDTAVVTVKGGNIVIHMKMKIHNE